MTVKSHRDIGALAMVSRMLLLFGLAGLILGAVSEASAQQTWTFPITVTATNNVVTLQAKVSFVTPLSAAGDFDPRSTTVDVPCNQGTTPATISFSGQMKGTTLTLKISQSALVCGQQFPLVVLSGTATVNAPFPGAAPTSSGNLTSTVPGFSGTFTAFCSSSLECGGGIPVAAPQGTQAARQAAAIGTVAVTTTSVQTTNIGLRLSQLRGGAPSGTVSVSGVSFSVDGQSVSLGTMTAALSSLGGGASADRAKPLGRLGLFANGQGGFGNQTATPNRESGFDFHTAGLTVGGDYRFTDNLILGLALGYLRTNVDLDAAVAKSAVQGYSGSVYGTYYAGDKFYVDGIATYGRNEYDNERRAIIDTTPSLFRSTTDSNQFSISASAGYNLNTGAFTFGPSGRVTYTRVEIDGYRERGDASFAATVGDQTVQSLTTALGGQATYAISVPWGVLTPLVRAEWEHEYKGAGRVITASTLAEGPTLVRANDPDRDYANLGAGASVILRYGVSAFAYYEAQLGRTKFTAHSFTGGVRIDF